VLRPQKKHLELQHRIERRPAPLRAVRRAERRVENRSEQREIDDLERLLERVARRLQLLQAILHAP